MTLLLGYGNPGRGDDGLGPAFADWAAARSIAGLKVITCFQLTVEHAMAVSEANRVVFVDASIDCKGGHSLTRLGPARTGQIDSHRLNPAAVLRLAELMFGAVPPAWMLAIGGTSFDALSDKFSEQAERNRAGAKLGFLDWYGQQAAQAQGVQRPAAP